MPLGPFGPRFSSGQVVTGASALVIGITGTVTGFNPPPSALAFILESESTNTINLRWSMGLAANSTIGILMEPGRDTGVIPCASGVTLFVCGSTSTLTPFQSIDIQWILGG